eukprot:Pompholyxophrys_sp_v1_NODE_20_length_4050_cov_7.809011.p1 type:complete len:364 gc:universal NODE_20_length_4050_cov_7.809011:2298-3389(+)
MKMKTWFQRKIEIDVLNMYMRHVSSKEKHSPLILRKIVGEFAVLHGVRPTVHRLVNVSSKDVDFEVLRKKVQVWRNDVLKDKYKDPMSISAGGAGRSIQRCIGRPSGPTPFNAELENYLDNWICDQRAAKKAISRSLVYREAIKKNPKLCGGVESPRFWQRLATWYSNFSRRKKFSMRALTSVGQKLGVGWEEKWRNYVKRQMELRKLEGTDILIPPEYCGNTDQTPIPFELVPPKTLEKKGAKSVSVHTGGKEKERITFMPTVTGLGRKLPSIIVFKGARKPADKPPSKNSIAKEISEPLKHAYPVELVYSVNPKAYVYMEEMELWTNHVGKKGQTILVKKFRVLFNWTTTNGTKIWMFAKK